MKRQGVSVGGASYNQVMLDTALPPGQSGCDSTNNR